MRRSAALLAVLAVLGALAPARAQLEAEPLPPPGPVSLLQESKEKEDPPKPLPPAAAAQAIALAFGPETWTKVKISTDGPVVELSRLVASGHYKLEVIQLVLLAVRAEKPLKDIVLQRDKGKDGKGKATPLKDLAAQHGQDYEKLYEAALAVEDLVDREYLPRFPQPRLRQERP